MRKPANFAVLWALAATGDLEAIVRYVEEDSPSEALRVLERLHAAASRLKRFPERGRVVPELQAQGVLTYRELVVPPWRIVYRIEASRVWVLAVVDSRRDLEDLLLQRLLTQ